MRKLHHHQLLVDWPHHAAVPKNPQGEPDPESILRLWTLVYVVGRPVRFPGIYTLPFSLGFACAPLPPPFPGTRRRIGLPPRRPGPEQLRYARGR
jgi:hypothetical protein